MASVEADIEMMETYTPKAFDDRSSIQESKSEDDDKDKTSVGDKNDVHKSDRKIGHRRVGVGGEITYKKIQTTQIMESIQLGIQHAVGGLASKPERDLLMQDFMTVETTNFPHEGSNHTPAHHYSEFRFKTYAPIAFRYFRDLFGIQPDDFLMSMCSSPLRESSNPGASGSIFYLTEDDEFIIKTVQHKEGEFLQKLLPGYYMNLNQNPRTLLPKFFGLYCYQCNSKNVRLVAMNNLLPSVVKLHQKYDLKGSTYKRKASKSERNKKSPTFKDLDFMEHHPTGLFLEADTHGALVKTIQRDCRVLESFKIMDYSLLVGVHNLDRAQREKAEEQQTEGKGEEDGGAGGERSMLTRTRSEHKTKEDFNNQVRRTQSINRQRLVAHSTAMESIQAESEPIDEEEDVPPGGIPARNGKGERLLLFVGVIDILQSYRFRKKLEHTWKSMVHDGDTVSVHRPSFYAQRFQDFMAKKVFMKIPSLDLPEIKGNHRKFRTLVTSYIALKHSPSKRKSISRPLRPHEEPDSGAGTSVQPSSEEVQFPRVLWVELTKPRNQPDTPEDATLSPKPIFDDSSSYLSPEYPRRRRFSSDTDSSFSSRVPSPFHVGEFRLGLRSIQGENEESDASVFDRDDIVDGKLNSSTPQNPKSGGRKISFAVDGVQDERLRSPSSLSDHSSIAEALKDMPYIDNVEDNDRSNEPENSREKVEPEPSNAAALREPKKDEPSKVNKATKSQKKGFFSGIKSAIVKFFSGEDGSETNEEKTEAKGVDANGEEKRNTTDRTKPAETSASNTGITTSNSGMSATNTRTSAPGNGMDEIIVDVDRGKVTEENGIIDVAKIDESRRQNEDNIGEELTSSMYAEKALEDDFNLIPYNENRIDIVRDIEVCTDFAKNDSIEPDLEVTWRNSRRSRSLSDSIRNGDRTNQIEDDSITSLSAIKLTIEGGNMYENSTRKFLDVERFRTNEYERKSNNNSVLNDKRIVDGT